LGGSLTTVPERRTPSPLNGRPSSFFHTSKWCTPRETPAHLWCCQDPHANRTVSPTGRMVIQYAFTPGGHGRATRRGTDHDTYKINCKLELDRNSHSASWWRRPRSPCNR
jgi:hypothetical protein